MVSQQRDIVYFVLPFRTRGMIIRYDIQSKGGLRLIRGPLLLTQITILFSMENYLVIRGYKVITFYILFIIQGGIKWIM